MYARSGRLGLYASDGDGRLGVNPAVVKIGVDIGKALLGKKTPAWKKEGFGSEFAYLSAKLTTGSEATRRQWWASVRNWANQGVPAAQQAQAAYWQMFEGTSSSSPAPSSVAVQATTPVSRAGNLPPLVQEVIRQVTPELLATPTGQEIVRTAVNEQAKQSYTAAAPWLLPAALGVAAIMLLKK